MISNQSGPEGHLGWNRAILSEHQSKKQFIKKWWGKPHLQEQRELFHIFGSRRLEEPSPEVILKCSANTLNKREVSAQNENLYNPLKKPNLKHVKAYEKLDDVKNTLNQSSR